MERTDFKPATITEISAQKLLGRNVHFPKRIRRRVKRHIFAFPNTGQTGFKQQFSIGKTFSKFEIRTDTAIPKYKFKISVLFKDIQI
jgi:hypothetical protein